MTARVGVNLLWLVPGVVGGSEESTVASLRAIHAAGPADLDLQLFVVAPFADAHPELVRMFPTMVMPMPTQARVLRIAGEATWLARRASGCDLVHHAGGTAPLRASAPYVVTVHDLQPLEHTATHGPVKRAYLRAVLPRSVAGARAVVVPSEFVRRSVIARLGVEPGIVHVIPHGVAPWPASPPESVRARYRLGGPIVLYPAITYPHKEHRLLVEAFARVLDRHPDAVLVLSGGAASAERDLRAAVERLGIAAQVRRTGRIPAADLAALYRSASVVAVPSRYEGFGLPAAEAMAFGAPVVAADAAALPEVVGDAGRLVPPGDVAGWADAISALLADPEEARRLGDAGLARASTQLTWAANAERLLAVYRAALP